LGHVAVFKTLHTGTALARAVSAGSVFALTTLRSEVQIPDWFAFDIAPVIAGSSDRDSTGWAPLVIRRGEESCELTRRKPTRRRGCRLQMLKSVAPIAHSKVTRCTLWWLQMIDWDGPTRLGRRTSVDLKVGRAVWSGSTSLRLQDGWTVRPPG
jgi:hypothetical protein